MLQGEGHYETLRIFITEAILFYKEKGKILNDTVDQIKAYSFPKTPAFLSYPGKITVSKDGKLIAISDSAHNRVIIANAEGEILVKVSFALIVYN